MMSPDQVLELFDRQPQTFCRIPVAASRLQLDRTFGDARDIVPFLDVLGVTDCYLSPFFQESSDGARVLGDVFASVPVALLARED